MNVYLIARDGHWCWYLIDPLQAFRMPYSADHPREKAIAYLRKLFPKGIIKEGQESHELG